MHINLLESATELGKQSMTFKCAIRRQSPRGGYELLQGMEDDQSLLDNSLTNLSWLQNLKVPDLVSPKVGVRLPSSPPNSEEDCDDSNSSISRSPELERYQTNDSKVGIALSPIRKCLMQSAEFKRAPKKYRSDPEKPPFAYSTIIYLAIQQSKSEKVTLNEIYRWIKDNFKYFKQAEPGWQNSIRHNLSLNELFVKVPRSHSKGNYWKINPDYDQILSESSSSLLAEQTYSKLAATKFKSTRGRKRAHSQSCCHTSVKGSDFRKRVKSQSANNQPADPCGLPGDLNWVSLLSSQKVINCGLCPSQNCRPTFGSPILGTPDLGHIGEPVVCSPLVVPTTLAIEPAVSDIPSTPLLGDYKGALLEEVVLKQDSPSPQLLPWAESRSQSPLVGFVQPHPWSESKETTQHELKNLCPSKVSYTSSKSTLWSPESSWSSSSTYSSTGQIAVQAPRMSEACIY